VNTLWAAVRDRTALSSVTVTGQLALAGASIGSLTVRQRIFKASVI
jgi:hypothetical protein